MAYKSDRERVEGWPKKGTRAKLKARAKRAKAKSYSDFIATLLEEAAQGK